MNERITQIYNNTKCQKTNKQIQIELKVKNVSKIRSRILYMYTYIFNNYRITIFANILKYPYQHFGLK